jgi:putative transposase
MRGFAFRTGLVFDWSGVAHRVERLGTDDQIVLERLSDGQVVLSCRPDLLAAFADGAIQVQPSTNQPVEIASYSRPLADLPETVQSELRRRLAYLQAMDTEGVQFQSERHLKPVIAEVAKQISDASPPSWITVYRWHRKYRLERKPRALIPRFDRRGSSSLRQPDRILELFAQAAEEAFKASPAATVQSIHARLVGKINADNRNRLPEDQLKVPADRTSYRLLDRLHAYDQTQLREGKAAADRRFRIAKAAPQADGILQRVEADHTPLDLFLIDERSGLAHGRPILTMFIDTFSRFPVGYFLNFGGTSAAAVMGALRHAILPKTPVPDAIPNLRVEHTWPCYGVMDCLALDNGLEFHGTALEGAAMDLGIYLLYCPKRQPWYKGKIERFLRTLNFSLSHQIPGTSLARLADRGDYDPQKHAVLTMAEFKHLFDKWLLDVYAQTIHKGIGTTPWAKWHEGLKSRTPELPGSLDELQARIGLVEERTLQRDGLTLRGIRYGGPELDVIVRAWGPGVKLRIVYDPEDLGAIQVWAPEQQEPVRVRALNQEYAKGLTKVQHELIQGQLREEGKAAADPQALMQAKYDLAVSVDQLVESRKQRTRRRAAKIQGVTSSHPEAEFQPKPPVASKPKPVLTAVLDDEAPQPLPTFRLRHGGT